MSKKYKVPESLCGKDLSDENHSAIRRAANKHGKQLSKAEGDLFVARDLAVTLRGLLCSEYQDPEIDLSCTADTVVELIEKRIAKSLNLLDSHSRRHTNLFVAYFDLKEGAS